MLKALFLDRMCPKDEAERFNRYASMKSNVRAQTMLCPPVALQVSSINRRWLGVDPLILSCFDEDFPDSSHDPITFFAFRSSLANHGFIRFTSDVLNVDIQIMNQLASNALIMTDEVDKNKRSSTIIVSAEPEKIPQRLGVAGLALHYANIINQIDTTLSAFQVKAEMEKTLQWLVPLDTNTTKAHQGFGWVGEWANSGHEFGKSIATNINPARVQTLYHAHKHKTDKHILDLVILLHRLISVIRNRDCSFHSQSAHFPTDKGMVLRSKMQRNPSLNNFTKPRIQLSKEERNLLDKACRSSGPALGRSKSQDFAILKKGNKKVCALSRSAGNSPIRNINARHCSENPNLLDVIDGLDPRFSANLIVEFCNLLSHLASGLHEDEVWDKESFYTFMKFVDASLCRFCKLKLSVQKFRLSTGHHDVDESFFLLDKWIGLVVENEVKTLDLNLIKHYEPMLNSMFFNSSDFPPETIELDLCPQIPISSINAPCPWEVGFDRERPLETNLKDFLRASNQIKDLCIDVKSRENSSELDKFQRSSPSPPCEVGHLDLFLERVPPNYAAFLSGLLSVCHPRILSLEGWNNTDNFFQWLYDELRKRDAKCCSSHSIKCWWHDLKDCKIDGFTQYGDADDADIDDSMIMLLKIPPGILKFHLDW
ncbi:hypothetical protein EZV62_003897 [Acer yangbiense]|uniref:Uncharacterized protein n=1 Tax=Acer yangbiense TaxID=1000413 RepID=A0A5C7IJY9_9ROSI|nr:hypothetical protein EZV62_003897 [Acer yangbiense]